MKHKRNPGLFWFSFLGLALGVLTAQAQTNFWWTNNASGVWNASANWSNEVVSSVPVNGGSNDYAIIFQNTSAVVTTNNAGTPNFFLNQLQFASGSGGVTIFGGAGTNLVFTNNSAGVLPQIVQNSASNITLNIGLTLATNTSFAGTGTGTLTVGGVISGASQLILNGPYTVALTNNNTYTGGTVINTGAVAAVYSTNSLGGGVITINGGTLRPTSGIAWAYTTPITNAVTLGTGNITNLFDVGAQSFQLNGIISGGALSVTGTTGRLILNNTGNTYTNTIISANSTSTPATASSVGCPPPPKPTSPLSTPARSKTAPALRSSTATAPC